MKKSSIPFAAFSTAAVAAVVAVVAPVSPTAVSAAEAQESPTAGIYLGGTVGKYFSIGQFINLDPAERTAYFEEAGGFANLKIVNGEGEIASFTQLLQGAGYSEYQAGDIPGTYEDVDGNPVEVPGETEFFEVTEISAINETEVNVTFPSESVEEADLEDKTITLTDGESELTATFESLDGDVATFVLGEDSALVDATEYTVSADWATFEKNTFVAKVADVYVADFVFVTSGLTDNTGEVTDETDRQREVNFQALNQYGEEVEVDGATIEASVTKGSFPLNAEVEGNTITINQNEILAEGDELTITLTSKVEDEVVGTATTTIVVSEATDLVQDSVSKIEVNSVNGDSDNTDLSDLSAGDHFELQSTVLDQFNNAANDQGVRWVTSDASVVALAKIDAGDSDAVVTIDSSFDDSEDGDQLFLAQKEGTVTLTAYTKDGQASKEFEVTVGKGSLATIDADSADANVTNKSEAKVLVNPAENKDKSPAVNFKNANKAFVPVLADDITVEVTPANVLGEDFTAEDIEVVKEVDAQGYLTGITVKSNRTAQTKDELAGEYDAGAVYTVTLSSADEEVKEASFEVTSKIDKKVAAIELGAEEVSYRIGNSETVALTFTNKYGEEINVTNVTTLLESNSKLSIDNIKFQSTNKDGKYVDVVDGVITGVKFISLGDQVKVDAEDVTFAVGTITSTVNVTIDSAATIDTINLGSNLTTTGALIAGKDEDVIKPITIQDQDGNDLIPSDLSEFELTNSEELDSIVELKYYYVNDEDEYVAQEAKDADDKTSEGVALVFNAISLTGETYDEDQTYTVSVSVASDETEDAVESNEISVKVSATAVVDSVSVEANATNIALLGSVDVLIKPVDQYDELIVVDPATDITFTDNDNVSLVGPLVAQYEDEDGVVSNNSAGTFIGYKATIKGDVAGTTTVEFKVGEESGTQQFNVAALEDVVDSVEIKEVEIVNNSGTPSPAEDVTLEAVAKDAEGNEVAIDPEDLTWTVESIKDADGNELTWYAAGENGNDSKAGYYYEDIWGDYQLYKEVAQDKQVSLGEKTGELTVPSGITFEVSVKVETANKKSDTVVVNYSDEDPKFVSGLTLTGTVANNAIEAVEEGKLEFTIDDPEETSIVFTFSGIDQYGNTIPVTEQLKVSTGNRTVAEASSSVQIIGEESVGVATVDAKGTAGTTTLFVEYGGEVLEVKVTVTETPE